MTGYSINGIQQVGIGVENATEAWKWYRKAFGMNVPIFEDRAEAKLMTRYTSGKVHSRHAILAMNMQGGGGFEIWQYESKKPQKADFDLDFKNLGILAVKIRCRQIEDCFNHLKKIGSEILTEPCKDPLGVSHFFIKDPFGNTFELRENSSWFSQSEALTGGVCGVTIGTSSIDQSLSLYQNLLQHPHQLLDQTEKWEDLPTQKLGSASFRRVFLQNNQSPTGAFGKLLCQNQIELLEYQGDKGVPVFENRDWGDLGFIHVCFDVNQMDELKSKSQDMNMAFTVDSQNNFDMGEAAGRFSYLEDPDGTLIEFVETYRVPIFKKLGLYFKLKENQKPLPNIMVKALGLNRVKD